jgi:transcriptional regulator with XRE-family HTH domain
MDIPIRLATWRAYYKLTLQVVADRAHVNASTVCQAETGAREPRQATLRAIVERGLRITVPKFYGRLPKIRPSLAPKTGRPRKSKPALVPRAA